MKLNPLYLTQVPSCEVTPLPVLVVPPAAELVSSGRVVEGMSNQAYHAHPSLSHSLMRHLEPAVAPVQFWHRSWLNPERGEDSCTVGMNTGRLLHEAMEDFGLFQDKIHSGQLRLLPDIMRTKKPGCIGAARGGQLDAVLNIRARLMQIPLVQKAMAEGNPETSLFVEYPLEPYLADIYGQESITMRCRPDLDSPDAVLHWKFVSSMDPYRLGTMIDRLRYIEAIAHYRHCDRLLGLPERRHIIVFVETYAPYEVRMIEPSSYRLDECQPYGERAVNRFIELFAEYGAHRWPDYANAPQNIYPIGEGSAESITLPPAYDRRLAA